MFPDPLSITDFIVRNTFTFSDTQSVNLLVFLKLKLILPSIHPPTQIMSVSTSNQDYYNCDQQDRSDGSVVGSEGKLKSSLSKTTSNETYLTSVDTEDLANSNLNIGIKSSSSSSFARLDKLQVNIPHPSCSSSSSSSSSSSLLPSQVSYERHSTESIVAEKPTSTSVLPLLQIPSSPSKPAPKKSASFSYMKTVPSNSYLNHPNYLQPLSPPHQVLHQHHPHPSNRVPSRELQKGCSRITRSKSNLSLVKKNSLRDEFEFPRINVIPHLPHHHHHEGQVLLPRGIGHQHGFNLKKNRSFLNQYPLCATCLHTSRESSSSFKLRKDFILEMQEERRRIQDLMNRRKIRKQQKSNEKLALIAILLINVAFFISFCFLGMMFLRSVRLPSSWGAHFPTFNWSQFRSGEGATNGDSWIEMRNLWKGSEGGKWLWKVENESENKIGSINHPKICIWSFNYVITSQKSASSRCEST